MGFFVVVSPAAYGQLSGWEGSRTQPQTGCVLSGAGITWCVSAAQPLASSLLQQRVAARPAVGSCFSEQLYTGENSFQSWYFFCLLVDSNGRAKKGSGTTEMFIGQAHGIGLSQRGHRGELSRPTSHSPGRDSKKREDFNSYLLFDHDFSSVAPSCAWSAWLLFPVPNLGEGLKWSKGLLPSFQSC